MAYRIDRLKETLVEKVAGLVKERLDPSSRGAAEQMVRAHYANVSPEDLLRRDAESLYGAAMALFAFARARPPGQPKLRVYQPRDDEHGWECDHGVLEIVNDDMPFLVDSVVAFLHRRNIDVHLIVHPILAVERDPAGHLLGVPAAPPPDGTRESWMQLEIDRQPADQAPRLVEGLTQVLADVRVAVEDWQPMRQRVVALMGEVGRLGDGQDPTEVAEAGEFLRWIHDDNFTFLGACDFRFEDGGNRPVAIRLESDSGLGLLRDPKLKLFDSVADMSALPPEVRAFLARPYLLLVAKADRVSTVHRDVPLDIIGVKRFDEAGKVVGMHGLIGLFTHTAYTLSPLMIPVLRRKVQTIIDRAGFPPASHDAKALLAILENFPRDELLQAGKDQLFDTALGILRLQERQRVAVFLRDDEFKRFVSALVFIPRDRYDTQLRQQIQEVLEEACSGKVTTWYTRVGDSPLARLHFLVAIDPTSPPEIDRAALEARLAEVARSWSDRLQEVLVETHGEDLGLALYRHWGQSFPASYREATHPRSALIDIERIEAAEEGLSLHLFRPVEAPDSEVRFKIYRYGRPVALSDVLPVFEHMGFKVISELPHELRRDSQDGLWIHDFTMATQDGRPLEVEPLRDRFEEAFRAWWRGEVEDDGFNRLVVTGGLTWRQVMVLRAYAKYLRQAGSTFSQSYVERSVAANPAVAAQLVRLFESRFDPHTPSDAHDVLTAIAAALDAVRNADEDRILRRFLNLMECTLRTNYFQTGADGRPKAYLSIKLDSRRILGLPAPRPMVEIFVYAPRVEGIHLRGGKVARGGIRWSDRLEDFRTEILGLMKAQMVKNAVIVPVGSKGGFVVKPLRSLHVELPADGGAGGRESILQEGIACYQTLIRGLLDLTDNLAGGQVVPPPQVVRRDGDDPYLVVAADKGTATFSDIANAISGEYGFWLGDAFASGGSQGYDHKVMGITARGAWESVKRHFREMARDVEAERFTAVGVGDMSGDVFGNGMLRSPHMQVLAAFDHRHIFLDPDPDPAVSFGERKRLFELPRSSWADYDPAKLSPGGGVFPRDAKTIPLSSQVRDRFSLETDSLPPADLIRTLLAAQVDLLWFGGIGTYVKASQETNVDVGDRGNEALRIDGKDLRCKVVAEGANLAVTQRGRIEAALAGVRLNSDAIDNSAGVDTSDHEVNIKVLLDAAVAEGDLTVKQRNELLAGMGDQVARLVLRDNYLQTQAISILVAQGPELLDEQARFMRLLERSGRLDRDVEFLPSEEDMNRRAHAGAGLTRPEVAVILAYGKLWLYDAVLDSDLPDDPRLLDDLVRYFPTPLHTRVWRGRMERHRLRREIIATATTNSMINRIGSSFVARVMERTATSPAEVARAYLGVRDGFALREVWEQIEALDNKVPAAVQTSMLIEANRLLERGVNWVLAHAPRPLDIGRLHRQLEPGIATVRAQLGTVLPQATAAALAARAEEYRAAGVPDELAQRVASLIVLASANDIASIAAHAGRPVETVARLYFLIAQRFGMGWLRAAAERLGGGSHWQKLAIDAVIEDLYGRQAEVTASVAQGVADVPAEEALAQWIDGRRGAMERADQLLGELKSAGRLDLATLIVASHHFRGLADS
jgi:glutamate dehydrogenase